MDNWHIEETELVDIFAQKISMAGVLVGEVMPICRAHGHQWGPEVAFSHNSDKYIITWTEGGPHDREYGVWGSLIDATVKGDVNADGIVDLKDAIRTLQVTIDSFSGIISKDSDVNEDEKIGLPEAIYILDDVSN